jgi:hypothetical protein
MTEARELHLEPEKNNSLRLSEKIRDAFLGKKGSKERKKKVVFYRWVIGAVLGMVALVAAEHAVAKSDYLADSKNMRIIEAGQTVDDFRAELQETGEYNRRLELISPEIRGAVNRIHTLGDDGYESFSTGTTLERFFDEYGQEHLIQLIAAHAIPNLQGKAMWIHTEQGMLVGHAWCMPYDLIGRDNFSEILSEPIRDLALCDVITAPSRETIDTPPIKPLGLKYFRSLKKAPPGELLFYGFPVNKANKKKLGQEEVTIAILKPEYKWRGYQIYGGEPAGAGGGSGGVIIKTSDDGEEQYIVAIMAAYDEGRPGGSILLDEFAKRLLNEKLEIHIISEMIPAYMDEKIEEFKQRVKSGTPLPNFNTGEFKFNFKN